MMNNLDFFDQQRDALFSRIFAQTTPAPMRSAMIAHEARKHIDTAPTAIEQARAAHERRKTISTVPAAMRRR